MDIYIKKAKRTLGGKKYKGIYISSKVVYQVARIWKDLLENPDTVLNRSVLHNTVYNMICAGVETHFLERVRRNIKIGKTGITLRRCLILYGRAGYDRWNEYKLKQAESNRYEYKKEKHGMTREEFDEYNQSRASCLDNFIKRHGEEEGKKKWDEYVQRQSYAGVTEQYFIDKHGADEGARLWSELLIKKAHTVEGVLSRNPGMTYEEAVEVVSNIHSKTKSGYSLKSQKLFWKIYEHLSQEKRAACYFAELNKEYGKYDHDRKCYRKYDFVLTEPKIVIEFNGDYFHANPNKYKPTDEFFFGDQTAAEIWKDDLHKQRLIESHGFKFLCVWESDYDENPQEVLLRCLNAIYDEQ